MTNERRETTTPHAEGPKTNFNFDCPINASRTQTQRHRGTGPKINSKSRFTIGENQDCALKILIFELNLDHSRLENQDRAW